MKNLNLAFGLLIILMSQAGQAAVCTLTYSNGGYWSDGRAREIITCNKGNPDSRTIVERDTDDDVPTALNSLVVKGYKIVTQNKSIYTLAK